MPRKVILDVDPGIDDAMALCWALFNPQLDVVAVTAVGGNCASAQATRNMQAIVETLDPPRWPRLGAAADPDQELPSEGRGLYGPDGLGGVVLPVAERQHLLPADKVICEEIRAAPDAVTLVALGPLTNVARAFQRDPELASLVGRVVIMGGSVTGPGNITPAAEFNIFCDPLAAQNVFRSPSTKTLIPLDVTNRIQLSYNLFDQLPDESTKVGWFLRQILPAAFRGYRQQFGVEGIHVHDTVTLMAVAYPELFTSHEMAGDVETTGLLTRGMTVFDRRRVPAWRHNMEVAVDVQQDKVVEKIIRGLQKAAHHAQDEE
ncbi:MAG: nucleoside hydrolase [Thermoguttaceae bacterium]|jgi:purine nucleosidase